MKINIAVDNVEEPRRVREGDVYIRRSKNPNLDKRLVLIVKESRTSFSIISLTDSRVYDTSLSSEEDVRRWLNNFNYTLCEDVELIVRGGL